MDDVKIVPASQDVALLELRVLHENSQVRRADYQQILQALIPGGGLLDTLLGRRLAGSKRLHGLAALNRIAHLLDETSLRGLRRAINELIDTEGTPK